MRKSKFQAFYFCKVFQLCINLCRVLKVQVYLEKYLYPSAHRGAQEFIEKSLELEKLWLLEFIENNVFFLCKISLDPFQHFKYWKVCPLCIQLL